MSQQFAEGYIDVATRIVEFREKHPEGSLQPFDPSEPIKVFTVGDQSYLQYVAAAYRSPDDPRPGIGIAWEIYPGRTPYTKGSEAMVAETSAWGRAIVAAMAADTKRGVASADEIHNAQDRRQAAQQQDSPPTVDDLLRDVSKAADSQALDAVAFAARNLAAAGHLLDPEVKQVREAVTARRTLLTTPTTPPLGAAAPTAAQRRAQTTGAEK